LGKTTNHGQARNESVRHDPRNLGRPRHERTLAVVNIIRLGPFPSAGGPEPRKDRYGFPHSTREYPRPMTRVGGPYNNGHRAARMETTQFQGRLVIGKSHESWPGTK
jgi:hypothetical protein